MGLDHFSYRLKCMALDAHRGGYWLRALRRAKQQMRTAKLVTVLASCGVLVLALGFGCRTSQGGCAPKAKTPFEQALEREAQKPPSLRTLVITVDGQSQSFPILLPGTNITVEIH